MLHGKTMAAMSPSPAFVIVTFVWLSAFIPTAISTTDTADTAVLKSFIAGLKDTTPLADWVSGTDPCGEKWTYVFCTGTAVTQLQLKNLNLQGSLPSDFNNLKNLEQIALQGNSLSGPLPSFSGMSKLTTAYLGDQKFTSIPADFFQGLTALTIFTLQNNPVNASTGWSLPQDLSAATGLTTLILTNTTLSGPIPDFLGNLTELQDLRLGYNNFNGGIPASFAQLKQLSRLELANNGGTLSGSIQVVVSMSSLVTLWLQVNSFNGTIPDALGSAVSLQDCRLNDNQFVGFIPASFATSSVQFLSVNNNHLVGPIPAVKAGNYSYSGNDFCTSEVGAACDPQVSALLSFLEYVNFPLSLTGSWDGKTACSLKGITCDSAGMVVSINLPSYQLTGSISPSLANLTSLSKIVLSGNNLTGTIPTSLTGLSSLMLLDVHNNNLYGPVPTFNTSRVTLSLSGNVNINNTMPPPASAPSGSSGGGGSSGITSDTSSVGAGGTKKSTFPAGAIAGISVGAVAILIGGILGFAVCKRRNRKFRRVQSPNAVYIRPSQSGDGSDIVKITIGSNNNANGSQDSLNVSDRMENSVNVLEVGNLVISIQIIREVTNNFSEENVLGRGGFGVVYKGELDDGTKIAVKRMQSSAVSNKGLEEFQAEIAVLTKVRHRHLVALLGYCVDGNERLLVYEYMPMGTLSQHLFEWKELGLQPFGWERRLSIALDVARGIEYLHGLAHKSFIHRDLKPSNILLGDDYRAKVSDFGLVKLAPDGGKFSVETRLAGTFGYLAPEYAVTGRVTTKSDVFSFGVILMELLTGRKALDDSQSEENMHLVSWFRRQLVNKGSLFDAIDNTLEVNDKTSQSMLMVAELAGHCTVREPQNRPDMSHAVNVLSPLVEQWKPTDLDEDDEGIDLHMTLPQALEKWQAYEGNSATYSGYLDGTSISSIPARPAGLAQTFTSIDGR